MPEVQMDLIRFKFVCFGIFANTILTKELLARLIQTRNDAWRPLFLLLTGTYNIQRKMTGSALSMDEGTLKTPIPKCRLTGQFCLGWWSKFEGSESGQKQSIKLLQNMVYSTMQHPPIPLRHSHTLSVPQSTQSCNGCFLAYIQWWG